MNKLLVFICCLLGGLPALAQQPLPDKNAKDVTISTFYDKEADLIALIERQNPQLDRLQRDLNDIENQLAAWEDTLKYRDNIPIYRDKALRDIARLRERNDRVHDEIKNLNLEWFTYQRHLMAVYTRFGELSARGQKDEHLRQFLLLHRTILFRMEDLLAHLKRNVVQINFLLNAKLN